jgi:DNA-binding phage protein
VIKELQEDSAQEIIRAWVQNVLQSMAWKPYRLAKEAGVSPATISRALDQDSGFVTSTKTIEKIVRATGMAPPTGIGMGGQANGTRPMRVAGGMAEPEAIFVQDAAERADLSPLRMEGPQGVWQLQSRSIELAGFIPDDFLLVDPREQPVMDDAVCVQIYDLRTGAAETTFRIYDPPYVTTQTLDPRAKRKPVAIDNERALIWGVVVKSLRLRRP